jgi:hypothetical protein
MENATEEPIIRVIGEMINERGRDCSGIDTRARTRGIGEMIGPKGSEKRPGKTGIGIKEKWVTESPMGGGSFITPPAAGQFLAISGGEIRWYRRVL